MKSEVQEASGAPRETSPAELMLRPFRDFAKVEASAGILLVAAAVVALVWSNSRWSDSYARVWQQTTVAIDIGTHTLAMPVVLWVNDLLMAMFFLLVGLEIKREVLVGQLADTRKAALPIVAAAGGMVVPGLLYAMLTFGSPAVHGWGVPVATDIAFALGVLTLMGKRAPVSLKVFLASLAIADDIGALLIIAVFYTEGINLTALSASVGVLGMLVAVNYAGFRSPAIYMLLGLFLWALVHASGVHSTIAGVALAMTIPARARVPAHQFLDVTRRSVRVLEAIVPQGHDIMTSPRMLGAVHAIDHACGGVATPLQRLEHGLHPWVAFLIVPVFALGNAGVPLGGTIEQALGSGVTYGVILGLFVGKPVGIMVFSWLAVRSGLASLPSGVGWRGLLGAACLAGIGFTMSLFIAHLAFEDPAVLDQAKVGILVASTLSGVVGWLVLRGAEGRPPAS